MNIQWPNVLGVMALPGATLFPGALLPLYIFEPRYREMLAGALESHRMFAVGVLPAAGGDIHPIGGAGIIRACVANSDGTSNLILQGAGRVRFAEWVAGSAYRQAAIAPLSSHLTSPAAAEALREEIRRMCLSLEKGGMDTPFQLEAALEKTSDLEAFSDFVSATMVGDPVIRQSLLEELDVNRRLNILAAYLTQLGAHNM